MYKHRFSLFIFISYLFQFGGYDLSTSVSTSHPTTLRKIKKVKYLICDVRKLSNLRKMLKSNFDYVVNFVL